MPNGSGLIGHGTAGQCALIIPIPCNESLYVIFHTTEFSSPGNLNYTVVDMSLNGGLGDVVVAQKNISLGSGWTEKLCAIYNPNDNSYWLLTHRWGNNEFVAFKINSSSIATQSVVSTVGSAHNCGTYSAAHDAMGQLTISKDGTKIANALTCQDKFELFDFNLASGVVSNPIVLAGESNKAWGTAFSPNGKVLYTNSIFGQEIFQYNLSVYTQASITASKYSLLSVGSAGYNFGYMELGPNNKLYITRPSNNSLAIIHQPNLLGSLCIPDLIGQSLGSSNSMHGVSRTAYNIPSTLTLSINISSTTNTICFGESVSINASGANNYNWSTGATTSSIIVSPNTTNTYSVISISNDGCRFTGSLTIYVSECVG